MKSEKAFPNLQFLQHRLCHRVRVCITGQILMDALLLMRNPPHATTAGLSPSPQREQAKLHRLPALRFCAHEQCAVCLFAAPVARFQSCVGAHAALVRGSPLPPNEGFKCVLRPVACSVVHASDGRGVFGIRRISGFLKLADTGPTGFRSGTRGGMHNSLKHSDSMHLEDAAAESLDVPVAHSHPPLPWTEEGLAATQHKPSIRHDMSDRPSKCFPEMFIRRANSVLEKRRCSTPLACGWARSMASRQRRSRKGRARQVLKESARRLPGETGAAEPSHATMRTFRYAGIEGATGDGNDRPCAA